jgi:AraC-like DNA-binding protein
MFEIQAASVRGREAGPSHTEPGTEEDALTWRKLARAIEAAGFCQPVSLHQIARQLAMSPRTLQRRLRDEGITHRQVIALVRRNLALELLSKGAVKLDDVADRLGFCNAGAFHRAFKRWTGMTPGDFRRRQNGTPPDSSPADA